MRSTWLASKGLEGMKSGHQASSPLVTVRSPRSRNFCFEHEFYVHESHVRVHNGMVIFQYWSVSSCNSGASPDLGFATSVSWVSSSVVQWHSMRSSLSSLRNSGFLQVVKVQRAHSSVGVTSTSLKQLRNCTFLHSVHRSLSFLRNTVRTLVSPAIAASDPLPSGQCEEASNASCAGTPCDCSVPPVTPRSSAGCRGAGKFIRLDHPFLVLCLPIKDTR